MPGQHRKIAIIYDANLSVPVCLIGRHWLVFGSSYAVVPLLHLVPSLGTHRQPRATPHSLEHRTDRCEVLHLLISQLNLLSNCAG